MSQLQVTGEAKIRDIQGPVVANSGVVTALDGAASQYVRGDGTLADFPTSTGGGSSVSYYLNSSVSQGTIGGVAYRELSKEPIIGSGTDIAISSNGYVASYITDANDPSLLEVPGGNFNCEFYFSVNNNTGSPTTYAELYKYDGTTFTLLGSSAGIPESINQGTTIAPYYFAIPVATAALAVTDRIAIRIYVNVDGRTVTLHTENSHLCQVVTTFSKGMISLNNLTKQNQYLATGTSGTNFAIVSSGDTHTFNLPVASATNTGKLSNTDWSTFNAKQPAGNYVTLDTTQTITAAKTISGLLTVNNKIYLQTDLSTTGVYLQSYNSNEFSIGVTSGATTYYSNFILQGANRNYTFPNTDGTIALTSNLSAYVPYTGATANVDLGLFGLTSNAVKAIGDNSTYGGVISIKQNNVIGGLIGTGYTELFGKTNRLGISFGAGSIAYLSNSVLTAERTFTLPDLSGTLALTSDLNGYVPYNGATTGLDLGIYSYNGNSVLINGNGTTQNGTLLFKQGGGLAFNSTGYSGIGILGTTSIHFNFNQSSGVYKQFNFNVLGLTNNTLRTLNIPDATGTIALTSDLSAYLPLTGGTLTGALSGTSATFSGDLTIDTNTLYVDSTNNRVGIGTSSPDRRLSVVSSGAGVEAARFTDGARADLIIGFPSAGVAMITAEYGGAGDLAFGSGTSRTERMRITSGGNVGIGTSSPTTPLYVVGPMKSETGLYFNNTGANGAFVWQEANTPLRFATNDTERMRIDANGRVFINCTSTSYSEKLRVYSNDSYTITSSRTGTGSEGHMVFENGNGAVGTIFTSGTSTSYNTSSDYRLKQDLKDYNGLDLVSAIKTYDYEWIADETRAFGVLAHELAEVIPYAVNGEKDGEQMQGVDYSKIVPVLVKAIQELNEKIKQLENK